MTDTQNLAKKSSFEDTKNTQISNSPKTEKKQQNTLDDVKTPPRDYQKASNKDFQTTVQKHEEDQDHPQLPSETRSYYPEKWAMVDAIMDRHSGANPSTSKAPIDERIPTAYSDRANELRNSINGNDQGKPETESEPIGPKQGFSKYATAPHDDYPSLKYSQYLEAKLEGKRISDNLAKPDAKLHSPAYKTKWTGEEYACRPWKSSAKTSLPTTTTTPSKSNTSYIDYLEAKYQEKRIQNQNRLAAIDAKLEAEKLRADIEWKYRHLNYYYSYYPLVRYYDWPYYRSYTWYPYYKALTYTDYLDLKYSYPTYYYSTDYSTHVRALNRYYADLDYVRTIKKRAIDDQYVNYVNDKYEILSSAAKEKEEIRRAYDDNLFTYGTPAKAKNTCNDDSALNSTGCGYSSGKVAYLKDKYFGNKCC